jgi:hypothetical protein
MNDIDVSVVIPTCRRPDLLQRCLIPLLHQTLEPSRYEIVVVDDGRTEDTRKLVRSWARRVQAQPRLRYLRPEHTHGPAAARNCGWRSARGAVIAFTDDDTVPDRDWLRQGLLAIEGHAALRGRVKVPIEGLPTDHARVTQGLEVAEFVTANCFVRRSALEAVDGFDERFLRAWREDSDLHFKLLRRYGEVPKAPLAVVEHPVRQAPFGISLKQQANMMFDALLYKKHPDLYAQRLGRVHAPPAYYAIVGATLAAPFVALAHRLAALGLLGLAFALIVGLAARRLRGTARTPEHVLEMLLTSAAIPFLSLYWRLKGALRFRVRFF